MKYTEYKATLMAELQNLAEQEGLSIHTSIVDKVNFPQREAISIKIPASESLEKEIGATFYPDDLFRRHEDGESIQEQIKWIKSSIKNEDVRKLDFNLNAEEILKRCFPELIGVHGNESLLKETPHRLVGDDMALIVRVRVCDEGSFIVKDQVAQTYKLGKNELIEQALENQEGQQYNLVSLHDKMVEMLGGMQDVYPTEGPQIMVLTNNDNVFGAAEIMNRKAMRDAAMRMSADEQEQAGYFWVLPSSLHETLLVPVTPDIDVEALKDIVRSVNQDTVAQTDLLSNSVYYYDSVRHSITNADKMDFTIRNKQNEAETEHRSRHM